MCRTLIAFALTVLWLDPGAAEGQATDGLQFRARSNASGTLSDCSLRARSNSAVTADHLTFRARPRNHALAVSAVTGVNPNLTNGNVDATFAAASTLLQAAQNPPADVTCCVSITRTGNVGNFAPPAGMVGGVISNQAELNAVAGVGADLMVVNGITFCGQNGSYAGCATGGAMILVRGQMTAANSTTIAHELGHREGLCHTGPCPCGQCGASANCTCAGGGAFTRDVMFCSVCAGAQDTISAAECGTYQANATQ